MQDRDVYMKYTNYKGETRTRHVTPIKTWFGKTDYHTELTWLLRVWDHEKDDYRDFKLEDCDFTNKEGV